MRARLARFMARHLVQRHPLQPAASQTSRMVATGLLQAGQYPLFVVIKAHVKTVLALDQPASVYSQHHAGGQPPARRPALPAGGPARLAPVAGRVQGNLMGWVLACGLAKGRQYPHSRLGGHTGRLLAIRLHNRIQRVAELR